MAPRAAGALRRRVILGAKPPRRRSASKDDTKKDDAPTPRRRAASKDEPKKEATETPRRRAGSMEKKPPKPKSARPCKYWRMGNCEKGAACLFSHGAPPSTRHRALGRRGSRSKPS